MIGGYLYTKKNEEVTQKLNTALDQSFEQIKIGVSGVLFHDNPYPDSKPSLI